MLYGPHLLGKVDIKKSIHGVSDHWLNGINNYRCVSGPVCFEYIRKIIYYYVLHNLVFFLPHANIICEAMDGISKLAI